MTKTASAKARVLVKPCPFCGNFPAMGPWHGGGAKKRSIRCIADSCDVSPMVCGETPTIAARRWNNRSAASIPRQIEG